MSLIDVDMRSVVGASHHAVIFPDSDEHAGEQKAPGGKQEQRAIAGVIRNSDSDVSAISEGRAAASLLSRGRSIGRPSNRARPQRMRWGAETSGFAAAGDEASPSTLPKSQAKSAACSMSCG